MKKKWGRGRRGQRRKDGKRGRRATDGARATGGGPRLSGSRGKWLGALLRWGWRLLARRRSTRGLRIISVNTNGLVGKKDQLVHTAATLGCGLIGVQETRAGRGTSDEAMRIPGFTLFRRDRGKGTGGGLAIFAAPALHPVELHPRGLKKNVELQLLRLSLRGGGRLHILNCYRQPSMNAEERTTWVGLVLEVAAGVQGPMIFLGDTNLDPSVAGEMALAQGLITLGFRDLRGSWEATHGLRNIDYIWARELAGSYGWQGEPIERGRVAHNAQVVQLPTHFGGDVTERRGGGILWKKANWATVRVAMAAELQPSWGRPLGTSAEDTNQRLANIVSKVVSMTIPVGRPFTRKPWDQPWFSPNLRALKKAARESWKRLRRGATTWADFKRARGRWSRALRESKTNYARRVGAEAWKRRRPWEAVRILQGHTSRGVGALKDGDSWRVTDADKAEALKNTFASNFATQAPQWEEESGPLQESEVPMCSVGEAWDILRSLPLSKAPGMSGVPADLFKRCAGVLAPVFAELVNKTVLEGRVPESWKGAVCSPVPKVPAPVSACDWRPVCLLEAASRPWEKWILRRLEGEDGSHHFSTDSDHGMGPMMLFSTGRRRW